MDKQKIFYYFLTVILCVIALNLTLKLVFKTDQINQGKFSKAVLKILKSMLNNSQIFFYLRNGKNLASLSI